MRHQRPCEICRGVHAHRTGADGGRDAIDAVGPALPGGGLSGPVHIASRLCHQLARIVREIGKGIAEADDQLAVDAPGVADQAIGGDNLDTLLADMGGEKIGQFGVAPAAARQAVLRRGRGRELRIGIMGYAAADIGSIHQGAVAGFGIAWPLRRGGHLARGRAETAALVLREEEPCRRAAEKREGHKGGEPALRRHWRPYPVI